MTIAAGFTLDKWIVMFSDTEYTKGTVTYDGPKIFQRTYKAAQLSTCFAIAGSVPNARQGIRKVEEAIEGLNPSSVTQAAVIDAAERALEPIYDRLRKRNDYLYEGGPQFNLLMAVHADHKTVLYANYEDVFNEVHGAEFIGNGDVFARYLSKPIFRPAMALIEAVGLANYILERVS